NAPDSGEPVAKRRADGRATATLMPPCENNFRTAATTQLSTEESVNWARHSPGVIDDPGFITMTSEMSAAAVDGCWSVDMAEAETLRSTPVFTSPSECCPKHPLIPALVAPVIVAPRSTRYGLRALASIQPEPASARVSPIARARFSSAERDPCA